MDRIEPRSTGSVALQGQGPAFIKLTPKTVRYLRADVERWIRSSVQYRTGEPVH
jgi:predicted DNA-binding transcriptional regulator AlpA